MKCSYKYGFVVRLDVVHLTAEERQKDGWRKKKCDGIEWKHSPAVT